MPTEVCDIGFVENQILTGGCINCKELDKWFTCSGGDFNNPTVCTEIPVLSSVQMAESAA